MKTLLAAAFLLVATGCAQMPGVVNLDTMPNYNTEKVNAHWSLVTDFNAKKHWFISMLQFMPEPDDAKKQCVQRAVDDSLYWHSGVVIALYQDNVELAKKLAAKADSSLDAAANCLADSV